jgi:hypothetical protein
MFQEQQTEKIEKLKKNKKVKISKLKKDPALERTFASIVNSLRKIRFQSHFSNIFFSIIS